MNNEFDPQNSIIQLCLQGMIMEKNNQHEAASELFNKAWQEATNDFERFYAAYNVSRYQNEPTDQLKWLEMALQLAETMNNTAVNSAYSSVYIQMSKCCEALGKLEEAEVYLELSNSAKLAFSDKGPFYHGTKADLEVGDSLTPGGNSNYQEGLVMNHIYFTANINGAGLAAALASGEGRERIYMVEPLGPYEADPNVTDKMFPGNATRSYRSSQPLKIIGEVTDWLKLTQEERAQWRDKLANNTGEIIN